jgi:hypothetical protein
MKTFFRKYGSQIAIGLLLGAVIALTALVVREAHIIAAQRDLIRLMWEYVQEGCPQ